MNNHIQKMVKNLNTINHNYDLKRCSFLDQKILQKGFVDIPPPCLIGQNYEKLYTLR